MTLVFSEATDSLIEIIMRGAPEALSLTKQLASVVRVLESEEALAALSQVSSDRFASPEGREGIRAFTEKRTPTWVPADAPTVVCI